MSSAVNVRGRRRSARLSKKEERKYEEEVDEDDRMLVGPQIVAASAGPKRSQAGSKASVTRASSGHSAKRKDSLKENRVPALSTELEEPVHKKRRRRSSAGRARDDAAPVSLSVVESRLISRSSVNVRRRLPADLLRHIILFCNLQSIHVALQVCQDWRRSATNQNVLWRRVYQGLWPETWIAPRRLCRDPCAVDVLRSEDVALPAQEADEKDRSLSRLQDMEPRAVINVAAAAVTAASPTTASLLTPVTSAQASKRESDPLPSHSPPDVATSSAARVADTDSWLYLCQMRVGLERHWRSKPFKEYVILNDESAGAALDVHEGSIAYGSAYGMVRVRNVRTCNAIHTLWGHVDNVVSVRFSRSGRFVVSSSEDLTVRMWDTRADTPLGSKGVWSFNPEFPALSSLGLPDPTSYVDMCATETHLATSSAEKIYIWDIEAQKRLVDLDTGGIPMWSTENSDRLALGYAKSVALLDMRTPAKLCAEMTTSFFRAMSFHGDTVMWTSDTGFSMWDLRKGRVREVALPDACGIDFIGRRVLVTCEESALLYDMGVAEDQPQWTIDNMLEDRTFVKLNTHSFVTAGYDHVSRRYQASCYCSEDAWAAMETHKY